VAQNLNGKPVVKALTWDQKPNIQREKLRVEQEGGQIDTFRDRYGRPSGPPRVWFKLPSGSAQGIAMTRSLGDFSGKQWGLSACPVVEQFPPGDADQVLVLASDGLWDMIGNQETGHIVLRSQFGAPEEAASKLRKQATDRWMVDEGVVADDLTIMVATLRVLGDKANAVPRKGSNHAAASDMVLQPSESDPGQTAGHTCANKCCTCFR